MLENLQAFDEKGMEIYQKLVQFADFASEVMDNQPSANDGHEMAAYLQQLQSVIATAAEMNGYAKALEASVFYYCLTNCAEEPAFKVAKNSSTSTAKAVQGKYPKVTVIVNRIEVLLSGLKDSSFTYRTLVSSKKEEIKTQAMFQNFANQDTEATKSNNPQNVAANGRHRV